MQGTKHTQHQTKWSVSSLGLDFASGGLAGTYLLVIPHTDWADLEEKLGMASFRGMLVELYSPQSCRATWNPPASLLQVWRFG
jgi:hypothetical protein